MNRRHFLATSTAAVALAATTAAPAQTSRKLKVLIPTTKPDDLAELKAAAPEAELVECRDEAEALEQVRDAVACYGFITPRLIRAGKALRVGPAAQRRGGAVDGDPRAGPGRRSS